jgi:hypothetical protein
MHWRFSLGKPVISSPQGEFILGAFAFHLLVKLILLSGLTSDWICSVRLADGGSAWLPDAYSYAIDPVMMGLFEPSFLFLLYFFMFILLHHVVKKDARSRFFI